MSRRRRRSSHGQTTEPTYPAVTIAQYGPDDKTVTKIVAAFLRSPDEPTKDLQRWVGTEVTTSPVVRNELLSFLAEHKARSVILTAGVIGCIHEEGEDYPDGGECPICPFWKGRDRWADARLVLMTFKEFRDADHWPG